jgi:hypothetical protein
VANGLTPSAPASDERLLLLESRLEQMRGALAAAREEADRAREKLAAAVAREAEHARRHWMLHEELSEARTELAAIHRHLERSEALRARIAGHLFEADARTDSEELLRLRLKALSEDQRVIVQERTLARLRGRVEELTASRETLLARVAEWQQLIREDGPEAADLSEFLAELRREILDLEHRSVASDARELQLRQWLARAGIDPEAEEGPGPQARPVVGNGGRSEVPASTEPASAPGTERPTAFTAAAPPKADVREPDAGASGEGPPADRPARRPSSGSRTGDSDALIAELLTTDSPALRSGLLLRLGRSGEPRVAHAILPWTDSSDASLRATAYEALGRLFERDPSALEPHLRRGLADAEPRVRRRVALAAATARGLDVRPLLDGLLEDPDHQVRRVVREVLRQAQPVAGAMAPTPPSEAVEGAPPPRATSVAETDRAPRTTGGPRDDVAAALASEASASNRSPGG